jgi:hypothetical protein
MSYRQAIDFACPTYGRHRRGIRANPFEILNLYGQTDRDGHSFRKSFLSFSGFYGQEGRALTGSFLKGVSKLRAYVSTFYIQLLTDGHPFPLKGYRDKGIYRGMCRQVGTLWGFARQYRPYPSVVAKSQYWDGRRWVESVKCKSLTFFTFERCLFHENSHLWDTPTRKSLPSGGKPTVRAHCGQFLKILKTKKPRTDA